MKKLVLTLCTLVLSFSAIASNGNSEKQNFILDTPIQAYQVCKFSISYPTGTVSDNGYTRTFTALLSCPQEKDVHVTVTAYVDGVAVGNEILTISAGKTRSSNENHSLYIGKEYAGKRYTLTVE